METWKPDRAREILKHEGRSQVWLAKKIGSKPSYISHLLNGRANPSLSLIKLMALALETTEEYLLGVSDEQHPQQYRVAK